MTEWNIQSRGHACEACGKPFVDKEAYHTLLFDERANFRRSDICQACWQKQYREGHRVFIYEQTGTGDVFTIVDPGLHLNQLEQVQHDVGALLEHGLNPPAVTAPAGTGISTEPPPESTTSEAPTEAAQSQQPPEPAATPRE